MFEKLLFVDTEKETLLNEVKKMHADGYMLSMISVNKNETFDLLYSFEKGYTMTTLRVPLGDVKEEIESICEFYPYSYLYENEAKELFGINIVNIALDFNGTLYKKSMRTPFAPRTEGIADE
jgi:ech hydrogenase subunit D